jgi:hypothetical protein
MELSNDRAVHAPWGHRLATPGVFDEVGVEFLFTREDFKRPGNYDLIFGVRESVHGWAITSQIQSRWGLEVNKRWMFLAPDAEERFRELWIAGRDTAGFDHDTTMSQARAEQWMSHVMLDSVRPDCLPDV